MKTIFQRTGIAAALALSLSIASTPVLAHKGAHGVVKQRMKEMMRMEKRLRLINAMAAGRATFDARAVRERARIIREHAARIPELFPPGTHEHPSEASPIIWRHFDDFRRHAAELRAAADTLAAATPQTLPQALRQVRATCRGCHEKYRVERDD